MSLKQIYKTCQLLLRTEQKSIERDDFSIINDDSTILYREGRLVDVNTGLVTINDDTFGNKVSLQGFVIFIRQTTKIHSRNTHFVSSPFSWRIPERIALQLEILHTPFGSFNLNTFKIEMKNIIDSAHAPSDAFNNLKKTLIQIEYKIFLFNRATEALKSLLILGPRILFLNIDISWIHTIEHETKRTLKDRKKGYEKWIKRVTDCCNRWFVDGEVS